MTGFRELHPEEESRPRYFHFSGDGSNVDRLEVGRAASPEAGQARRKIRN